MNAVVKYSVFSFQCSVLATWRCYDSFVSMRCVMTLGGITTRMIWVVGMAAGFSSLFVSATDLPDQVRSFVRVPELTPSLTNEETGASFSQWIERVNKVGNGLDQRQLNLFERARKELSDILPKATEITFYSLIPIPATESVFKEAYPQRYEALLKLNRFHDCPILGAVTIKRGDEVERWMSFLIDQIMPGDITFCDFMPRHGFRITAGKKNVDLLMCFQCDQLSLPTMPNVELNSRPVFTPAVRDVLNALFDKNKIERDKPKKG